MRRSNAPPIFGAASACRLQRHSPDTIDFPAPVVWTSKRAIGDFCPASPVPRPGDPLPAPGQAEPGPAPRREPRVSRRPSFGRRFAADCGVEGEVSRELLSRESANLSGIFRDLPGFSGNSMESRACRRPRPATRGKPAFRQGRNACNRPDAPRDGIAPARRIPPWKGRMHIPEKVPPTDPHALVKIP